MLDWQQIKANGESDWPLCGIALALFKRLRDTATTLYSHLAHVCLIVMHSNNN